MSEYKRSTSPYQCEPTAGQTQDGLSLPSSLGVDDFHRYDLMIDARTPREYAEDHVPGAVNLPVVDDAQFAEVGTLHAVDPHAAYLLGAQYSLRNIAGHLWRHDFQGMAGMHASLSIASEVASAAESGPTRSGTLATKRMW